MRARRGSICFSDAREPPVTKFLIVFADGTSGRGSRGLNLYWFLTKFHGRHAVKLVRRRALKGLTHTCDVLFLGVPTEVAKDDLAGIRYRQMALFDYQDTPTVLVDERQEFLEGLTDLYLKVWVEPEWKSRWQFGVLPIRRQARLPLYLRYLKLTQALGAAAPERTIDVSFLGAGTGERFPSQRVEWLYEIHRDAKDLAFWGGLVASTEYRQRVMYSVGNAPGVFYEGKRISFNRFFDAMRRSKTVLTPKGNARWSYRHYEAIYAGAIPVSCDMRRTRVLIPLPLDGMVHVPDIAQVVPKVREALALPKRQPGVREANVEFLERYLEHGDYSRKKPELMDRFLEQLRDS